jgi:chemotaxis protein CheD
MVKIGPGELHMSRDPGEAIVTVLGSCVAACLRDPVARVGGMNHYMLPQPSAQGGGPQDDGSRVDDGPGAWQGKAGRLRYGSMAMDELLERIQQAGGRLERIEAKLFGAARLGPDAGLVGESNARFAEQYLRRLGVVPLVRELGGHWARRVAFHAASGRAFMSELRDTAPADKWQRSKSDADQGSDHR